MVEETAIIESQMEETRKALAEKVEALEKQVAATVEDTTKTVTDTVSSVTEAVQETVGSVTETVQKTVQIVKETFDFRKQVEQRPWLVVGGAAAVGYLLGILLTPRSSARSNREPAWSHEEDHDHERADERAEAHHEPSHKEQAQEERTCMGHPCAEQPHQESGFLGNFGEVLGKLKGLAIGTTAGVFGEVIRAALPESLRPEVSKVVERMTTALGGTPIHSRTS